MNINRGQYKNTLERREDILNDPVGRLIIRVAAPGIIGMLANALYSIIDTFLVSILGTSATASVGIMFSASDMIIAIATIFSHGASNYISRLLGEGEHGRASNAVATSLYTVLAIGVLLAVGGVVFIDPIIRISGASDTIMPYAREYAFYIIISAPFAMGANVLNNVLRAEGSAAKSMAGILLGAAIKIILDILFMFVFGMGVTGAGLATLIGYIVSFTLPMSFFFGNRVTLSLSIKGITLTRSMLGMLVKTGLPACYRTALSSISAILLNNAAVVYGDAEIAAISVVNRIVWLVTATVLGFGQGYQPISGYNLGAGRHDRVMKAFWFSLKTVLIFSGICALLLSLFSEFFISLIHNDSMVLEIGCRVLFIQALTLPMVSMVNICNILLESSGRSGRAVLLACSRQGYCFIPAVLLLPYVLGSTGVEYVQPIANGLAFCVSAAIMPGVLKEMRNNLLHKDESDTLG